MSVKQISIFVENRPGAMNEMTKVLAENNIDMRALSLAETEGFGIVRIIVDDAYEATTVLKDAGYINKLTPVVIVSIPDETGGLYKVLQILTDAEINVDYMYAILGGAIKKAPTKKIPMFNLEVPTELEGVDPKILDPRDTYKDVSEWEKKAKDLAQRFVKNFKKYETNDEGKALVAAGPQL